MHANNGHDYIQLPTQPVFLSNRTTVVAKCAACCRHENGYYLYFLLALVLFDLFFHKFSQLRFPIIVMEESCLM